MDAYLKGDKIATDKDINPINKKIEDLSLKLMPYNQASTNESLYDDKFKVSPQIRAYAGDAANTIQENPFGEGVWFIAFFFTNQGGGNLIVIDTYNRIKLKALNHGEWDAKWVDAVTQIGGGTA